jgi:4-carboxymuconolactone decarboxylase
MRIQPLTPPYRPETGEALARWMPPGTDGVEPLALFRLLMVAPDLADRMRPLGARLLGQPAISVRDRELLIARTTARCGAEYEWGVHITAFGRAAAGLSDAQVRSTAVGSPDDDVWDEHEQAVLRLADELHDGCGVSDSTLEELRSEWPDALVLEAVVCCGWYRLLSGVINTAQLEAEPWAERFPETP